MLSSVNILMLSRAIVKQLYKIIQLRHDNDEIKLFSVTML